MTYLNFITRSFFQEHKIRFNSLCTLSTIFSTEPSQLGLAAPEPFIVLGVPNDLITNWFDEYRGLSNIIK